MIVRLGFVVVPDGGKGCWWDCLRWWFVVDSIGGWFATILVRIELVMIVTFLVLVKGGLYG